MKPSDMLLKWRKMLIVGAFLVLAIVISLVIRVDDWSRDLSTNRAATSIDAPDPTLRSLTLAADAEEIEAKIKEFVERSPAWQINADRGNDEVALDLVRTTRWFRFADDIQVFLKSTDDGTQVDVHSQSRVGKGDLGQNPRNIRELLDALRAEFQ